MKRVVRNITSEKRYRAKFNNNIYSEFKKIAQKNNRRISWYLNMKLEELNSNNIQFKKYNTKDNCIVKQLFLKRENHKLVKRESYLKDITMRDYLQAVMEKVIRENNQI